MVTVTGYDAWLIASQLQLAPEQFLIFFPVKKADPSNFRLDHSQTEFNIGLAHVKEADYEKRCIFWLTLPDGYSRCGIYPLRPLVCQNYPTFWVDGVVHLRTDVLCPSGSWNLASMNLPAWRERLLRFQMEYDIYCYTVGRWNDFIDAAPQEDTYPINVYLCYLMAVYARLELVRQSLAAGDSLIIHQGWSQCAENRINPLIHNGERTHQPGQAIWLDFIRDLRQAIDSSLTPSIEGMPLSQCTGEVKAKSFP